MTNPKRALFALALLLLAYSPLMAQPAAQAPPPPPPAREGNVDFSFVGTSGNASTSALGLGAEYIARPAPWLFEGKVRYIRNESDDELKAEAFALVLRPSRKLNDRLSAFTEYGYLHDQFAGMESRNTIDGGLVYAAVRTPAHQLEFDAGIGYAHESRLVGDNVSTAQARAGSRYKYKVSDTAEITDELTFRSSLSESSDWRTANIAAIAVKIASIFSLKVSNTVRYVHAPVPGFETTDTLTSVALVVKF